MMNSSGSSGLSIPSGQKRKDDDDLEISPEVSLRLFKEGATFVFLDVPVGTEIGIDMKSWNTGEKFRGIKMIPPGLHFVYFSAVSKDYQNTAPRTGFYHFFERQEFLARKYDQRMEDISTDGKCCLFGDGIGNFDLRKGSFHILEVPTDDQSSMKDNIEELDKFLGPYPYNEWRTWVALTNRITAETLVRLSPPSGRILSAPELILDADQTTTTEPKRKMTKLELAEQALPKMTEIIESKIKYSIIPEESYPEGSTPQQISKFQLDKSWKLQKVIDFVGKPMEYLAELQFAFVTFLVGQHYDSFEHWKTMVQLLCYSDDAIVKHPNMFVEFISDIFFQIREVPEDFFVDIVTSNNFLFNCLQRLINNIKDQDNTESKLKKKVERFAAFLTSKFGWDFEEEFDDGPTVVDEQDAVLSTEKSVEITEDTDKESEEDEETGLEIMDTIGDLPIF